MEKRGEDFIYELQWNNINGEQIKKMCGPKTQNDVVNITGTSWAVVRLYLWCDEKGIPDFKSFDLNGYAFGFFSSHG